MAPPPQPMFNPKKAAQVWSSMFDNSMTEPEEHFRRLQDTPKKPERSKSTEQLNKIKLIQQLKQQRALKSGKSTPVRAIAKDKSPNAPAVDLKGNNISATNEVSMSLPEPRKSIIDSFNKLRQLSGRPDKI